VIASEELHIGEFSDPQMLRRTAGELARVIGAITEAAKWILVIGASYNQTPRFTGQPHFIFRRRHFDTARRFNARHQAVVFRPFAADWPL